MKLYGIKNCDTVKKAIKQLQNQQISYEFVDLKTHDLTEETVRGWLSQCPDTLVNKRSTTYRQVKETWLSAESDVSAQITVILEHPTLIKRPVLEKDSGEIMVGFDLKAYESLSVK